MMHNILRPDLSQIQCLYLPFVLIVIIRTALNTMYLVLIANKVAPQVTKHLVFRRRYDRLETLEVEYAVFLERLLYSDERFF